MSCILYRLEEGEVVEERVDAVLVDSMLRQGYAADPLELLGPVQDESDDDAAKAEYERLYGRKPGNMKIETVRQKVAEHEHND